MRITATKRFRFESAHRLPGHSGKCNFLHGHSYKLDVTVEHNKSDGNILIESGSSDGMVIDFSDLKRIVNEAVIEKLDHANLNDVFTFRPTAENMVGWLLGEIQLCFDKRNLPVVIVSVRLWETEDAYAEATL